MQILTSLLNLAYPPVCGICDKKLNTIKEQKLSVCDECLVLIKKNPAPYCFKCGRSMRGLSEAVKICWECSKREFSYERSWSAFIYDGVVKKALHLLKYSNKISLSGLFCGMLADFIGANTEVVRKMDAVIAVPLHGIKFREREFNQANLLASAVVKASDIKDLSGCLKRGVATRPQSGLDKGERFENIKGAFSVTREACLKGKNLLLVDDLFTTGATLNECASALKKAGANRINCLTFARGA
ncbi:MAG: ComF family protein [Candidatus Omnitrophica bacterium]|nr:ComF family protein [Candidatus Omnitrophota bacterium]